MSFKRWGNTHCIVLLSTDNPSSSAVSVFITHTQSSQDCNQLSILLKHLVRMGTSGVEIQLSRTGCLLINIPSNGFSIKVSLLFHQPFPCGLDKILSSHSSSNTSLVQRWWGQKSWARQLVFHHCPRHIHQDWAWKTSPYFNNNKTNTKSTWRKYVYIASIRQVQGWS